MVALKEQYDEVERTVERYNTIEQSPQILRIHKELTKLIRERSLAETLDSLEYNRRLRDAFKIIDDLETALTGNEQERKDEKVIWHHRRTYTFTTSGWNTVVDYASLLEVTASYLARPWMQHNEVEWILINSLMYAEIKGHRDVLFSGELSETRIMFNIFSGRHPVIKSGGDITKAHWKKFRIALIVSSIRYALPAVIIGALFFLDYRTAALTVSILYAIYLVLHLALWPSRYRKRKREAKAFQDGFDLLVKMNDAYYLCAPPVINPVILQDQLTRATGSGGMFSGGVFALLDRIMARDHGVFLTRISI